MIKIRHSHERGHFHHGWLDTYHTFSFADYHDPRFMGFRQLRVINEDRVEPGQGFETHSHRDMEIITYVVEGAIEHKDSMGNVAHIRPGEVQRMSAGTGVTHSEFNPSKTEALHLLQIWILPEKKGMQPSYDQKKFSNEEREGRLLLVASPDGQSGSVTVHQDVQLYASLLKSGQELVHQISSGKHAWVQVISWTIQLNGLALSDGDGAEVSHESELKLLAKTPSELILFDLA